MSDSSSTAPTQEQLLRLILEYRDDQVRFFDTIGQAAVDASLAFLNARLNRVENKLERASTISMNDVFLDILIAMALGPVAGAFVGRLTERFLRSAIRPRQAFLVEIAGKGTKRQVYRFAVTENGILAAEKISRKKIEQVFLKHRAQREKLGDYEAWKTTIDTGIETVLDQLKDLATAGEFGQKSSFQRHQESIDLVPLIQHFSEEQKRATNRMFNLLQASVVAGALDANMRQLVFNLLGNLSIETRISDRDWWTLRQQYVFLFEACLWSVYLADLQQVARIDPARTINLGAGNLAEGKIHFDERIVIAERELFQYLIGRFPHPKGNGTDNFVEHALRSGSNPIAALLTPAVIAVTNGLSGKHFANLTAAQQKTVVKDLTDYFKDTRSRIERLRVGEDLGLFIK